MVLLAFWVGQLQDEHVLGHPALFLGHNGSDAQRVALLSQDGVAAVARTVGPNFLSFRELGDVLGVIAWPCHVFLTRLQRGTHGVQGVDKVAVSTDFLQGFSTHTGHDAHGEHNIGGVSQLHAQLRLRIANRAHAEGNHVHGATLHGATESFRHLFLHRRRRSPVIGRASAVFILGTDEGARFHTCNVGRVGTSQVGVRSLFLVQLDKRAFFHQLAGQTVSLVLGAVYKDHLVRLEKLNVLADPADKLFVFSRQLSDEPWDSGGH